MTKVASRTRLAGLGLWLGLLLASCAHGDWRAALRSITVTPTQPSIPVGNEQPFTAIGKYWNGTVQDLTASVTWSSTSTAVATVDQGMATGFAVGTTTIAATDPRSGISGSSELDVTPAVLASIALTPTQPQIALGTSIQFTAMGTFPPSLTHDTPSVTTTSTRTMLVTAHAFSSSASWTPPGGMTEALEIASLTVPNGAGISLELNYGLQPAAGATGVKSATADSGADTGNTEILALSPGP